jgi:hypothetical protein
MASPYFIKALIRIAKLQGRDVLEAVITGQFKVISEGGGKILVGTTISNKSYSFQVPASLPTDEIMAIAEQALEEFDSRTVEEIDALLSSRPSNRNKACF